MLFFFESGKCARVPMESYATKQNRKKLLKAYSAKEPLAALLYLPFEQRYYAAVRAEHIAESYRNELRIRMVAVHLHYHLAYAL